MRTLVILWIIGALLLIAVRVSDPVAEAWQCRCDTCCKTLDRFYGIDEEAY